MMIYEQLKAKLHNIKRRYIYSKKKILKLNSNFFRLSQCACYLGVHLHANTRAHISIMPHGLLGMSEYVKLRITVIFVMCAHIICDMSVTSLYFSTKRNDTHFTFSHVSTDNCRTSDQSCRLKDLKGFAKPIVLHHIT